MLVYCFYLRFLIVNTAKTDADCDDCYDYACNCRDEVLLND